MMLASLTRSLKRATLAASLAVAAATLGGCATSAGDAASEANDPLEPMNRAIFSFNEGADILVMRPVAHTYETLVPDPIREAVHNFVLNLASPIFIANQLLQGDVEGAGHATGRMLTNTILGVGGIADVATSAGIPLQHEDFGQTLAVWGVGEGPYLVLPLLGPSNLRDAGGFAVDTVADPVGAWTRANGGTMARAGASSVDRRAQLLKPVDDMRRNSLDFYASTRSLYRQQRTAAINDSVTTASPDFPVFEPTPSKP